MADKDVVDTYGPEWIALMQAFDNPAIPAADNWSRLSSYHSRHGNAQEALWCSLRASGKSSDEACRIAYPEQAAPQIVQTHAPKQMER
jgi:hypothetical protein